VKIRAIILLALWASLCTVSPSTALIPTPSRQTVLRLADPAQVLESMRAAADGEGVEESTYAAEEEVPAVPSPGSGLSKGKALVLSTALPGAGQYYTGNKTKAKVFFIAEAAIWTSFVVFQVQGHLRKDSYIEYAELMTGVDAEGKSEEFYRALGQYLRSDPGPDSYNEYIRREARALYPDDRLSQEQYLQENGYFGEDAWEWLSEDDQSLYRDLRKKSVLSFERATYMLGLALANRVIAAMDATRSAAKAPAENPRSHGLRLEMKMDPRSSSTMLVCLTKNF
jgi:hypothetical protein